MAFLRHYALGELRDFQPGRRGRRGRLITDAGRFWLVGPGMTDPFLERRLETRIAEAAGLQRHWVG